MSKADNSETEGDYDQFDMWVNPGMGDADTPHATGRGAPEDSLTVDLQLLGMRIFNEEPGDAMIWDELRIGATWEDVLAPIGSQDVIDLLGDCNGDGVVDGQDLQCACASGTLSDVLATTGLLPGDFDADGNVAFPDFLTLSANFGQTVDGYHLGDADCSGDVGFSDFLLLSANFGQSTGVAAVPEPMGLMVWVPAICGLMVARRFRK
jgi:hypothetical protein